MTRARCILDRPAVGYLLLVAVLAVGLYANQQHQARHLRAAQVKACERGNQLRSESNRRIRAHETDRQAFMLVWTQTRAARLAEYRRTRNPYALQVARAAQSALTMERSISFRPVALVNCERVVPSL